MRVYGIDFGEIKSKYILTINAPHMCIIAIISGGWEMGQVIGLVSIVDFILKNLKDTSLKTDSEE